MCSEPVPFFNGMLECWNERREAEESIGREGWPGRAAASGDSRGAEQLYQRVLAEDSANVEAYYLLGVALAQNGNLDAAETWCRRAVELNPTFAEAHKTLGAVLANQGKLDEAAACYRRTL